MNQLLAGAVAMGFVVVALHFVRFWRQTRDALFMMFAIAFLIQGIGQIAFAVHGDPTEGRPVFYLPRLAAYLLILVGIGSKNLRRNG